MATLMQPFLIGAVPLIQLLNRELAARLNSDPQPSGLWTIDLGQLALSKPGAYRIIWRLIGGPVEKASRGQQGFEAAAPMIAHRYCRVRVEIRSIEARTVGLTAEDINLAERVQRAVIQVVNAQRSADYQDASEDWAQFTDEVSQRQVLFGFEFTVLLNVLDDPYLFKPIESVESTTQVVPNP
jgi:hypothetical protein